MATRKRKDVVQAGHALLWLIDFRFEDDRWHRQRKRTDAVVDALASTPWWRELRFVGRDHRPGVAIEGDAAVKAMVAKGDRDIFSFARDAAGTVSTTKTDAWASVDVKDGYLAIRAGLASEALQRVGRAFIDDTIVATERIRATGAHLEEAMAHPSAEPFFDYEGRDPLRRANRVLGAVVDVLNPDRPAADDDDWRLADDRAMANASTPAGVRSVRPSGLVVLRWVDDPRDRDALAKAASRHDRWLSTVLEVTVDDD